MGSKFFTMVGGGAGGETAGGQYTTGLDHPFQEATL